MSWRLVNTDERAQQSASFELATLSEREARQDGDRVQLIFAPEPAQAGMPAGERIWVRIVGREDDGYRGVILNDPRVIEGLAYGDEVAFGPEHIAVIEA